MNKVFNRNALSDIAIPEDLERVEVAGLRYYRDSDGYLYKSVTSFLSRFSNVSLQKWKEVVGEKEANTISRLAAAKGTNLHLAAELFLENKPNYKSHLFYDELFDWKFLEKHLITHIDNIVAQEVRMKSRKLQLAGTADCIAEYDGVLSLIDFKTSKREKTREEIWSYWIQTAAYAIMAYEMWGIKIKQLTVIMVVDKTNVISYSEPAVKWMNEVIRLTKEYNNAI